MGEVYLAEDTRLHRRVALKVLRGPVADDPGRRERFEREARAAARLAHPNIVTLYSIEEIDGVLLLTMEYVDGQPLSDILTARGLGIDRILDLALQLVDGLIAAHQSGIVHRDLKPGNVIVGADGRLRILDFGIAKLKEADAAASEAPTKTGSPTTEGLMIGTAAYMSPEQAEGRTVDHRTDIFSVGVVLFEMATGRQPFKGDTSVAILASILRDTAPPVTELNRALPPEFARIVRRCLAKDPDRRYQTALDLRNELEDLRTQVAGKRRWASSRRFTLATGAAALIVALVTAAIWTRHSTAPREQAAASAFSATYAQITSQADLEQFPSLSPDGKWVVYAGNASGNWDIYLQAIGAQTSINLTRDSPGTDTQPVFSPDGDSIAFRSEREGGGLFLMGRTGESVRRVTDRGYNPSWSPDGTALVFATENVVTEPAGVGSSEIWTVDITTGQSRKVEGAIGGQPQWSPHGQRIAYWTNRGADRPGGQRDIWTVPAAGGAPSSVTDDAAVDWNPVWSPDGRFLYFVSDRGGSINVWRTSIDERSGTVLDGPSPISTPSAFSVHLSFSRDGTRLAYASIVERWNVQKVSFDPSLERVAGDPVWVTRGSTIWWRPVPSPDGAWVAFYSGIGQEDIYIVRSDGSELRRLTNDRAYDRRPAWSPDGKRLVFPSNRTGEFQIWVINADGSGLRPLTHASESLSAPVWSPDGSRIAVTAGEVGKSRVLVFQPDTPWESQTPEVLPLSDRDPRFAVWSWSPDGRLLAGQHFLRTAQELSVHDSPPGPDRISRSGGGLVVYSRAAKSYARLTDYGEFPVWLSDSRRLVFSSGGRIYLIDTASKRIRELLSIRNETLSAPAVTRDDRWIFFQRGTSESDIWMATLKQ